jgi:hypothetical protein
LEADATKGFLFHILGVHDQLPHGLETDGTRQEESYQDARALEEVEVEPKVLSTVNLTFFQDKTKDLPVLLKGQDGQGQDKKNLMFPSFSREGEGNSSIKDSLSLPCPRALRQVKNP